MRHKLGSPTLKKNRERKRICKKFINSPEAWKDYFYSELHGLIEKDTIFSKLLYLPGDRKKINRFDSLLNFLKGVFIIPTLFFWKLFLIRFNRWYYKIKYLSACTLQDIKTAEFDYLFVLNTRDHIINALPVLENLEGKANSLVVTFNGVYDKYRDDFNNLKNTKVLFFAYELKNLPLTKYLRINKESKNKFGLLGSQNLDLELKQLIEIDKNFIKYHLKTELIQYYFFEKIFTTFDIKGVVSIVFTTAFELAKERGIPTFILQHGIGSKGHGHPYVSDYWFTFDDISREQLDEWLDNTVEILALGSPRFEYLKNVASLKRDINNFNKRFGSAEKRNVTYISTPGYNENELLFRTLKELRKKLPEDTNLIIKLHPRGEYNTKKEIKNIFSKEELKKTKFIKKGIDFYEILANSDVVISTVSTGMSESIAMDIPTLQVNFTGDSYPKDCDLSAFGWKEPIDDPDAMINGVLSMLSDKKKSEEVIKKQRWLKNRMFKNFGNCGKVIAETIVGICENEKGK